MTPSPDTVARLPADHVQALRCLRDAFDAFGAGPANKRDVAALDYALAALAQPAGWVSVEERLPEEERICEVWWRTDGEDYRDFDRIEEGGWQRWNDHYDWAHSVAPPGSELPGEAAPYTHWRYTTSPLPPEPPHDR